ncbi:MAG: glycosyltransferase family 39 protein, partial [Chloroflexi bacterium]|nr:glycosyltransferase family 39 protein [Chloroflexota bacterium]
MKLIVRWQPLALWGLALLGLILRLYGLNWDQGNSFHPDERQILFHVTALAWPTSFTQFFDPVNSPLNPHFFAYGSFPLYLLAMLGHIFIHVASPPATFMSYIYLGRIVSALFDSGTILVTGYLGLLLTRDEIARRGYAWNVALLAAALVAFTPLQVQLSHFYAVDTMLLFFIVLTLLACVAFVDSEKPALWLCIACLSYGVALATKISAAPLAVPLCAAVLLRCYRQRDLFTAVISLCTAAMLTLLVFLIAQPYTLLDMPNFIQQVALQSDLVRGTLDLPYVRQFAGTTPYVYEAQNMLLWGMGVTLGLAAFAGLLWLLWRVWKREAGLWLIVLSWVLIYGAITGSFYAKFMRYMLPIYPLFTLMAASVVLAFAHYEWKITQPSLSHLNRALPVLRTGLIVLVLAGTIFQGLALLNVYSQPNTRIQASPWLYSHLSPGSVLTYEQWDDPLPVAV